MKIAPLLVTALLLPAPAAASGEGRTYHPVAIRDMAHNVRTHVEVVGFVTYVKREADGDLHIRLCESAATVGMDRESCIVAECIPELPCERPRLGSKVRVRGVYRWDAENGHGWAECHPVEALTVLR